MFRCSVIGSEEMGRRKARLTGKGKGERGVQETLGWGKAGGLVVVGGEF